MMEHYHSLAFAEVGCLLYQSHLIHYMINKFHEVNNVVPPKRSSVMRIEGLTVVALLRGKDRSTRAVKTMVAFNRKTFKLKTNLNQNA